MTEDHNNNLPNLGRIDITSDEISFKDLEDVLESSSESALVNAILDRGVDPRDYIHQYEGKLHAAEVEAIQDYTHEADNLSSLQGEIQKCDTVMKEIEDVLHQYKADLATVSSEIRSLQEQSQSMKVRLSNRKSLQGGLSSFIKKIALMPSLIHAIMESPTDSREFSTALEELHSKLVFVNADQAIRLSAAFRDIAPELERLRIASIARCRDLLLDKIYDFKKPKVNIQVKQRALLKHRAAIIFLRTHSITLYQEVRAAYAEKVSSKLVEVFKNYWAAVERVEETIVTSTDLLGALETSNSTTTGISSSSSHTHATSSSIGAGVSPLYPTNTTSTAATSSILGNFLPSASAAIFGTISSPFTTATTTTAAATTTTPSIESSQYVSTATNLPGSSNSRAAQVFSLHDRASVLAHIDAPPLVLYEAAIEGSKFPFEVLFRSLSKLLVDISAHEYLFSLEFWGGDDGRHIYKEVFHPVTAFVQNSLLVDLQDVYDPIALLLSIRINREYSLSMARRAIPSLDTHFDSMNMLLWPRLKSIFDMQLNSLPAVASSLGASGSINSSGMTINTHTYSIDSEMQSNRVHPITERYSQFIASVLALHSDIVDGPLETNIERMSYAVMNVLLAMSRGFSQRGKGTVFLIHNFSHVVNVLKDAGETLTIPQKRITSSTLSSVDGSVDGTVVLCAPGLGTVGASVLQSFEDSLSRATSLYVESRLTAGAPQLVAFVKRGEAAVARAASAEQKEGGRSIEGYGAREALPVAKDFSARWERIVAVLNREIAQDFGASSTGRAVQQTAFTQLLLHWSRFLELLKRQGDEGADVAENAVTISSILYALKQYRLD